MRKFKTILCSLLSLCIIACPLASSITVSGAEDIDTLENKLDKLTKQSQEYQKTLDDTKNDISEKEAYSEALVGKIDVLSQKINATNQSINKLNTGIAQKKEQIDKGNKDIDSQVDALIDRLKAIDKAGSASDLEIVLGAKDLSDFIDKVNLVKTVSNIDKELIDNINDKLNVVNKQIHSRRTLTTSTAHLRKTRSFSRISTPRTRTQSQSLTTYRARSRIRRRKSRHTGRLTQRKGLQLQPAVM